MRRDDVPRFLLALLFTVVAAASCDSSRRVPSEADAGAASACVTPSDCQWGEIDHEILSRADCICLIGCPSIPQNRTTVTRRLQQFGALCDSRVNGQGQPCPVDDCATPPALLCVEGTCTGAR